MRLNKSTGDAIRILIACARAEGELVRAGRGSRLGLGGAGDGDGHAEDDGDDGDADQQTPAALADRRIDRLVQIVEARTGLTDGVLAQQAAQGESGQVPVGGEGDGLFG